MAPFDIGRGMQFGLTTPVVTLVPRRHATWEEDAGVDALREIAIAADRLGYHHLTCSDHVAIPSEVAKVRGGRYYDAFATLGFIAAVTQRIRLVTHVLVLPYHHPLEVAKRLGTLDRLSGGRVVCGVGVGSLREEFALLGVDFDGRGARYDDALRALRAALGRRQPEYHGSHFAFHDFVVDPCAVQARLPIWLGGRSTRSLRRALTFGDGWDPFGFSYSQLEGLLERARQWPVWRARGAPFDLVFAPERLIDVSTAAGIAVAIDTVAQYQRLGTTVLNLQLRHRSLQDFLDQLDTFMTKVAPRFSERVDLP
ncbi:MAG TPA: TIGR03619 family F420-dependent LLM class oxidoreductase [Candidatus Acidoferrales bacterium]|nr:TIGR03619 family F420-dependent LLM class oxidoreductase [Candidatus Acidoferrales bacterium]